MVMAWGREGFLEEVVGVYGLWGWVGFAQANGCSTRTSTRKGTEEGASLEERWHQPHSWVGSRGDRGGILESPQLHVGQSPRSHLHLLLKLLASPACLCPGGPCPCSTLPVPLLADSGSWSRATLHGLL